MKEDINSNNRDITPDVIMATTASLWPDAVPSADYVEHCNMNQANWCRNLQTNKKTRIAITSGTIIVCP